MSPFLARSGVSLQRIDMSGIGAEADIRRCLAPVAGAAFDPTATWPPKFPVTS
jgi:hypothetical protein